MEKDNPTDLDILTGKIQLIAQRIKSDSNPEELDTLKKLIKKNVPFTLRGYFTAYLLRELLKGQENSKRERKENPRVRGREERPFERKREVKRENYKEKSEATPRAPRVQREIPADAKTLYINLGKIGKIYARNLIDLIMKDTDITKDDIYAVRVHDKYSFVTMSEENCEKAIKALLGTELRGRTIQINISNRDNRKSNNESGEELKEAEENKETLTELHDATEEKSEE